MDPGLQSDRPFASYIRDMTPLEQDLPHFKVIGCWRRENAVTDEVSESYPALHPVPDRVNLGHKQTVTSISPSNLFFLS